MSPAIQNGSSFVKALALGSVQHVAVVDGATLPDLSPHLRPPVPLRKENRPQVQPDIDSLHHL